MNIIKQYGLERSGTNYIKALIEMNLKNTYVLASAWGAKHEKYYQKDYSKYDPRNDPDIKIDPEIMTSDFVDYVNLKFMKNEVFYIVSIKDPVKWIISYRRYLRRHEMKYDIPVSILIEKWNTFNRDWIMNLKYNKHKFYIVNHEYIKLNPKTIIERISDRSGIEIKDEFINIDNDMGEGFDVPGSRNILDEMYDPNKSDNGLITNEEIEYINFFADFSLFF